MNLQDSLFRQISSSLPPPAQSEDVSAYKHCQPIHRSGGAVVDQLQAFTSPGTCRAAVAAPAGAGEQLQPLLRLTPTRPVSRSPDGGMLAQDRHSVPVPVRTLTASGYAGLSAPALLQQQLTPPQQQLWGDTSAPGARLCTAAVGVPATAMPAPYVRQAVGKQQQQQNWAAPIASLPSLLSNSIGLSGSAQPLPQLQLPVPLAPTTRVGSSGCTVGLAAAADRASCAAASPDEYGPADDLLPSLAWLDIDLALDGGLRAGHGYDQATSPDYPFSSLEAAGNASTPNPGAACAIGKASSAAAAANLPTYDGVGMLDDADGGGILDYAGDGSQYLRDGENSLASCHVSDDFFDLGFELPASFSIADLSSGFVAAEASSWLAAACESAIMHGGLAGVAATAVPPPASLAAAALGPTGSLPAAYAVGQCNSATAVAAAAATSSLSVACSTARPVGLAAKSSSNAFGPGCSLPPPPISGCSTSAIGAAPAATIARAAVAAAASAAAPRHLGVSPKPGGHASTTTCRPGPHLPASVAVRHSVGQADRRCPATVESSFGNRSGGGCSSGSSDAPAAQAKLSPSGLPSVATLVPRSGTSAAKLPAPRTSLSDRKVDSPAAAAAAPPAARQRQRMQATEEILRSSGLLEATTLTGRVAARQRVIQFEIQKLKQAMHEFVLSIVCEEPEVKRRRYHRVAPTVASRRQ